MNKPITWRPSPERVRSGLFCGCVLAVWVAALVLTPRYVQASPVAVRFPEGLTHGFLVVKSLVGDVIGHGELTQRIKDGGVAESRLVFNFKDGSVHDETVAFSQQRIFRLIRYQLIQRGPSFPEQMDVMVDRAASKYEVRLRRAESGTVQFVAGDIELPKDAYNGMIVTTLLNLPKGESETVNVLAFTPEPTAITLELAYVGEHLIRVGDQRRKAWQYSFKPDIGPIKKFLGKMLGKLPADFHYDCYILADDVPGFVRFEGPLQLMGPVLSIELTSPQLAKAEDQKHATK